MTQTDCAHFQDMLDDYRRDLLSVEDTRAVSAHLESCEVCREELHFRNELAKQLRATLPTATVGKYHLSADLKQAINEMSVNDDGDRKHRSPLLPWMLAAAIVIIGIVGFYGMDNGAVTGLPNESHRQISMSIESSVKEAGEPADAAMQENAPQPVYSLASEPAATQPWNEAAQYESPGATAAGVATAELEAPAREATATPATIGRLAGRIPPVPDVPMPATTPASAPATEERLALYGRVPQEADRPMQNNHYFASSPSAPAKAAASSRGSAGVPAMAAIPGAHPPPAMVAAPPLEKAYNREEYKADKAEQADNQNAIVQSASSGETKRPRSMDATGMAARSIRLTVPTATATTTTLTSATVVTTAPLIEITTAGVSLP